MSKLNISLLGDVQFQLDGKTLAIKRNAVRALLIYLAVEQAPQARGMVAGLLWPDSSEQEARNNLRQTLHHLRQLPVQLVNTSRQWLTFAPAISTQVDVELVRQALQREAWDEAVTRYRRPFLGEGVPWDSPLFNEWMLLVREQLHRRVMLAYAQLLESAETRADWVTVERLATQQLALDNWRESTHRSLMRALAAQGRRVAALAQYDACRAVLEDVFAVRPSPETEALYAELLADVASPTSQPKQLQRPSSTLFGRQEQLALAQRRLSEPTCRILTLVGAGGMGKTRLALAIGEHVQQAGRAVGWVDLTTVSADALNPLETAISDALGLTLQLQSTPLAQLTAWLNTNPYLLIIDNMEHLLEHTGLLVALVQGTTDVQLLVTSRERLNVRGEWLIDVDALAQADAEALFIDVARQIGVSLRSQQQREAVATICQQVGGMPLAIELCARWLRTLDVYQVASELQNGIDILSTSARDVPTRHHKMQAVFDWSWQRLTPAEQIAMAQLTVFQAGFDRAGAQQVAGATIWELESLVERSLLRRQGKRYSFHPVIRQYGLAKLGDSAAETQRRFADFFIDKITSKELADIKSDIVQILSDWRPDLVNMHNAWRWLVVNEQFDALLLIHDRLYEFYKALGRFRDVVDWYDWSLARLGNDERVAPILRVRMYRARAYLRANIAQLDGAREDAEKGLAIALRYEITDQVGLALQTMGIVTDMAGKSTEARGYFEQALSILREQDNQYYIEVVMNSLGIVEWSLGEYESAEKHQREALALARKSKDKVSEAMYLSNLGNTVWAAGRAQEAMALFEQAMQLEQELGRERSIGLLTRSIGEAYHELGQLDKALAYKEEALQYDREHGHDWHIGYGLWTLGETYWKLGQLRRAEEVLREAVEHTQIIDDFGALAACAGTLGKVAYSRGELEHAANLLIIAVSYEGLFANQRSDFAAVLEDVRQLISAESLAMIKARLPTVDTTNMADLIAANLPAN